MLCSEKRQEYLKPAYWRELFEFSADPGQSLLGSTRLDMRNGFGHVTVVTPSLTVSPWPCLAPIDGVCDSRRQWSATRADAGSVGVLHCEKPSDEVAKTDPCRER